MRYRIYFLGMLSLLGCETTQMEPGAVLWPQMGNLVISEKEETAKDELTLTVTNTSRTETIVLNIGQLPLSFFYSFKGADYPGEGGTCDKTIASQESCTLVVEERLPLLLTAWSAGETGLTALKNKAQQTWKKLRPSDTSTQPAGIQP